jgi:hypothetical protein
VDKLIHTPTGEEWDIIRKPTKDSPFYTLRNKDGKLESKTQDWVEYKWHKYEIETSDKKGFSNRAWSYT